MIMRYRGFGQDMPTIDKPSIVEINGRAQVEVTFPGAPNPYPLKLVYDPATTVPSIQLYGPMQEFSSRYLYMAPGQVPPDLIQLDAPFDDRYGPVPLPQFAPPAWTPAAPPQVRVIWASAATPTPQPVPAAQPAAPVPQATPIGETTVDIPGTGATKLPVFTAPVARAEIIPDAQGRLVVVIPQDQPSNLPITPVRTASGVVLENGPVQFSPEIWKMYFEIPKYRRDLPIDAREAMESTLRAGLAASGGPVSADLVVVDGGLVDAEGRFYPSTAAAGVGVQESSAASAAIVAAGGNAEGEDRRSKTPWLLGAAAVGAFLLWRRK